MTTAQPLFEPPNEVPVESPTSSGSAFGGSTGGADHEHDPDDTPRRLDCATAKTPITAPPINHPSQPLPVAVDTTKPTNIAGMSVRVIAQEFIPPRVSVQASSQSTRRSRGGIPL